MLKKLTNVSLQNISLSIVNKGTGAGGVNTNYYGKQFEEKTNNQIMLLNNGYIKNNFIKKLKKINNYYLFKIYEDKTIIFVSQYNFKIYMMQHYGINVFRYPDEAYIIEFNTGKKVIKILEKKEQNVNGSVETKLWGGPALKREYELMLGDTFEIHYCFCVNNFLKNKIVSSEKKYKVLNIIFNEFNITILYGDDDDYFEKINKWINN